MNPTFIVIGGGLCALAAVDTLRKEGFAGRIVLIGEEPQLPYERPPLSKEYLRAEKESADLFVYSGRWYQENEIETMLGTRAVAIEARESTTELASGERLHFDSLLIASGGQPRAISSRGEERILYLRTLQDADRIRSHLERRGHLIVIGAGFIGAEVAASARTLGLEVTMLEAMDVPLRCALGPEVGRTYAAMHRDHGVKLLTRAVVSRIEEAAGTVMVRTERGTTIEGDVVVVGIGIDPNVELASSAGLDIGDGILVDEFCRTSIDGIYAAGDVSNHYHPLFGRNLRVEHYDNALRQGATAARNMLGYKQSYEHVHWFWSDQYDYNLQYAGFAPGSDEVVVRGSINERNFVAFYLGSGVLRAALGINRGKEVRRAMRLIGARASLDPEMLRDEAIDLRRLAVH